MRILCLWWSTELLKKNPSRILPLLSRWKNGVKYRGVNMLSPSFPGGSLDIFKTSPWWLQSDFFPFAIWLKKVFLLSQALMSTENEFKWQGLGYSVAQRSLSLYSYFSFVSIFIHLYPYFLFVSILILIFCLSPSLSLFSVCPHQYSFFLSVSIFVLIFCLSPFYPHFWFVSIFFLFSVCLPLFPHFLFVSISILVFCLSPSLSLFSVSIPIWRQTKNED